MMGEWSPIRISDFNSDTLDKNVLKFITTGVDDSAVIETPSAEVQKSVNSGKVQMVDEMLTAAEQELSREYPDPADLEKQLSKLDTSADGLQSTLVQHQNELDQLRLDRRFLVDAIIRNARVTNRNRALPRTIRGSEKYLRQRRRALALPRGGRRRFDGPSAPSLPTVRRGPRTSTAHARTR